MTASEFAAEFEAGWTPLVGFLVRRFGDPHLAEELAAEAYARAFGARERFVRRGPASFRNWVLTIALHAASSHFRRARHVSIEGQPLPAARDELEERLSLVAFKQLVAPLPERQRQVVVRNYLLGEPLHTSSVDRGLRHRALENLRAAA